MLNACDKALDDAETEIDAKKLLIVDIQTQNNELVNRNNELADQAGAFYHNPWVMTTLGLVLGVLAGVYVKK